MANRSRLQDYPLFVLDQSRHDQTKFTGRFLHCLDLIDPRTLLVSEARLQSSLKLLDDFRRGIRPDDVTNRQLWQAQKIKQATFHRDTGEKILMPFRMAGFVPFGSPIVTGLLLPNQSFAQVIFWQWLNQSHNACVNYANRNASKPTSTSMLVQGYLGATTVAVTISVGLTALIRHAKRLSPKSRSLIERFVPYPAVASASVLNVVLMRQHELTQGIDVFDSSGEVVGTSQVAAKKALLQMAITRAVTPIPILIVPPIAMSLLEKSRLLRIHPKLHLPFNAFFATITFAIGLPLGISLFPQIIQVNVGDLEPSFREKSSAHQVLYYNKGL